jgi:hypothetical protein
MAYSEALYTGDGTTTDFVVPFDYLDQSHVYVAVGKVDTSNSNSSFKFEFVASATIRIREKIGENPVPDGTEIRIFRRTPIDSPAIVFGGGASLSSKNLNKNSEYLTFALQEATDTNEKFTEMYLGSYNYDPLVDNLGNPLKEGALYYNTEVGELLYYTDGIWKDLASGPRGPRGSVGPTGSTGPPGPQGIQGVKGPQGVQGFRGEIGPKGATGSTGVEGPVGPLGPEGPRGPEGPIGQTGQTGEQGPIGETGAVGPQGPDGLQGPKGSTGPLGPEGPRGLRGDTGPLGPEGPEGPEGPMGLPGDTGDKGPLGDQGPMGEPPRGLAFGRFFVNSDGDLNIEFYGDASENDFTIDEDGFLSVTTI